MKEEWDELFMLAWALWEDMEEESKEEAEREKGRSARPVRLRWLPRPKDKLPKVKHTQNHRHRIR